MGKSVQVAFSGYHYDQRLNIHNYLGPAKYHKAEATAHHRLDEDTWPHVYRSERHGLVGGYR